MISDESCNRCWPIAVTDYWQDWADSYYDLVCLLLQPSEQNSLHFHHYLMCDPTSMLKFLFWQYLQFIALVHSVTDSWRIRIFGNRSWSTALQIFDEFVSWNSVSMRVVPCLFIAYLRLFSTKNQHLLSLDCFLTESLKPVPTWNRAHNMRQIMCRRLNAIVW